MLYTSVCIISVIFMTVFKRFICKVVLLLGVRAKQDDDPEGRQLLGLGLGLNPQIGLLGLGGLSGFGGLGGLSGLGGTTRLALMMRLQQICFNLIN